MVGSRTGTGEGSNGIVLGDNDTAMEVKSRIGTEAESGEIVLEEAKADTILVVVLATSIPLVMPLALQEPLLVCSL